jgi:hypothetical protein
MAYSKAALGSACYENIYWASGLISMVGFVAGNEALDPPPTKVEVENELTVRPPARRMPTILSLPG